jgi:hypothetical protein
LAPQIAALSIAARPSKPEAVEEQPLKFKEGVEEMGWIELDPAVSFQERVQLCDFMGGVHPNITADKSRLKRKVRRLIVLYDPRGFVSTEQMKRRMKENNDRPCDVDDGTGIGKTFPESHSYYALPLLDDGSVCLRDNSDRCAPVLIGWNGEQARKLDLLPMGGTWSDRYRFPAVSKEEFLET